MNFLKRYVSLIEGEIEQLKFPATPKSLYEPQSYILSNAGKRVRPILTMLGCGICGEDIHKSLPAALAIELLHNFTLIHDDIMDQAVSRRGEPTVHIKWDLPSAILSGDSMFVRSFAELHRLPEKTDFRWAHQVFVDGINKVCEGQALDMEFEERAEVTTEEYMEMISGKTAALTSVALQLGGIVANASGSAVEKLGLIGKSLGIAFQIQDDYLDLYADQEKFGKKRGGDIFEGKKTFLMVTTLDRCVPEEKEWLIRTLQNRPLSEKSVKKIIELYEKVGAGSSAEELMEYHYQKAIQTLETFDESNYKEDLSNLIKFLKNREY